MSRYQIKNPGDNRRAIQTRYDDYRAGRRLHIGMSMPGVTPELMGATADERKAAYEELADSGRVRLVG